MDEEFIYPVLFKGTTSVDYQMATFVLSRENNVTMQEMMAYYNEKEDTDACLRAAAEAAVVAARAWEERRMW